MQAVMFTNETAKLRPEALKGFFVGWPTHPDPERHLAILQGSHTVWLAKEGLRCVGFINAISDGEFCAFLPLLEVLPTHQGRGIGSELVRRMLQSLDGMYAVDIVCDDPVAPFYEKLGLSRCTAVVKRNYARQAGT